MMCGVLQIMRHQAFYSDVSVDTVYDRQWDFQVCRIFYNGLLTQRNCTLRF